ncbi:MAG: alpha-ketoglutarate-dependent taurine dioxygenase [Sediminicola sp.]|jgi:alpha-ketoglutarate-dependent taurine dioxygenase
MEKIKKSNFDGFICEIELRSDKATSAIKEIKEAILKNKVVKLIPGWYISDLRAFYDEITESLGKTLNIAEDYAQKGALTGERWMEVRYDEAIPDMAAYRHSKNAQPLHTDESYVEDPCDIMAFYCVNKAPQGGGTNFVDGSALIKRMQTIAPELLSKLTTTEISYEKAGSRRVEKIINLQEGYAPQFNYNYYCLAPDASDTEKQLNKEFFDFLETHIKGSYLEHSINLKPGEGVIWWDHFVLHGRSSFEAEKTNDRFIWKTGIQWVD